MDNLLEKIDSMVQEHPKFILWYKEEESSPREILCLDFHKLEERELNLRHLPSIDENTVVYLFHYQERLLLMSKAVDRHLFLSVTRVKELDQEQADILLRGSLGALSQAYPESDFVKAKDYYVVSGYSETKPKNYVLDTKRERSSNDIVLLKQEVGDLTVDEEDAKFIDQRGAPRARPKKGKMVTIGQSGGLESFVYPLFDLSMGGLAFLTSNPALYKVEDEIKILAFDEKDFEEPMIAIIRIVKELVEKPGEFKVGVQFLE